MALSELTALDQFGNELFERLVLKDDRVAVLSEARWIIVDVH